MRNNQLRGLEGISNTFDPIFQLFNIYDLSIDSI